MASSDAKVARPDPAGMSETIVRFLQLSQERALDEKITSFQDTIAALQERHSQEVRAFQEITTSQQDRYKVEIKALQGLITNLRGRHEEYGEELGSLQETVKSLQVLSQKAEADNTKLRDEVAELRARLSHVEESFMEAEISRTQDQVERSRHPYEPRQIATQLQAPSQRQPQSNHVSELTGEAKFLPQHEAKIKSSDFIGRSRNHVQEKDKPFERSYPRGIKRALVEDDAEPRRTIPAQVASHPPDFEQPKRARPQQTKVSDQIRADGDEGPRRKEKKQSDMQAPAAARRKAFVDYFKSMRHEYQMNDYGKSQRTFIYRFIDGIEDPVLSRWFQEGLKENFPEKARDPRRPVHSDGGRIVVLARDVTWEDVETSAKHTPWPSFAE